MHEPDSAQRALAVDIASWAMDRLADRAATLPPRPPAESWPQVREHGIGTARAWAALRDLVLPSAVPTDNPRYLAFVGGAASVSSVLGDMAVAAAGVYGGSELEAGSVVVAERQALRWLSDLVGYPESAHGAFVSGGSMANLSALAVARRADPARRPTTIIAGTGVHASIDAAAAVMGCNIEKDGDKQGRLDPAALHRALERVDVADVVAVVATAGATNSGAVDDLHGLSEVCAELGLWLHVDAAYGGAAMLAPRCRELFAGIESADSVTIDPHKWLFTPYDCAAILYRHPTLARTVHTQMGPYLEPVNDCQQDNPADYALHLSRRPRGLPLWMSLLAHGTAAYRSAVETCLDLADYTQTEIRRLPHLDVIGEPALSVVLFSRLGWTAEDYARWSLRARQTGIGLVTPTTADGVPALRLCFVNPVTSTADIDLVLGDLANELPVE